MPGNADCAPDKTNRRPSNSSINSGNNDYESGNTNYAPGNTNSLLGNIKSSSSNTDSTLYEVKGKQSDVRCTILDRAIECLIDSCKSDFINNAYGHIDSIFGNMIKKPSNSPSVHGYCKNCNPCKIECAVNKVHVALDPIPSPVDSESCQFDSKSVDTHSLLDNNNCHPGFITHITGIKNCPPGNIKCNTGNVELVTNNKRCTLSNTKDTPTQTPPIAYVASHLSTPQCVTIRRASGKTELRPGII